MSTYGTYINGEDPNKKKDPNAVGATTPTTPPVLPYEGFIGTGTGSNAYQQGVKYAQGVKDSIYGSAEALREQTEKNIENARQRGIVDSQSSYQKAVGTYGSNAETLAGKGLSGSGYGEYLTADAYATHRGNVQDINAGALEANREAANLEAQTKAAADSEYLKNLYSLGANLDTAKDAAYSSIFDAVANGTSLDVVTQSGAWGDLTPEQQQAITAEAEKIAADVEKTEKLTAIDTMIQNGDSTEDIKGSEEYKSLDETNRVKVDKILADNDEKVDNVVTAIVQTALDNEYNTLDELNAFLNTYGAEKGNLLSKNMKNAVVEKWTNQNVEESIKAIKNAKAVDGELADNEGGIAEDIAAGIKNGWYGDRTQEVITQYIDALIEKAPPRGDDRTNFFIDAYGKLKELGFEKESIKELEEILRTLGIFDVIYG